MLGSSDGGRYSLRAASFYNEYHGHKISHLEVLLHHLRPSASTAHAAAQRALESSSSLPSSAAATPVDPRVAHRTIPASSRGSGGGLYSGGSEQSSRMSLDGGGSNTGGSTPPYGTIETERLIGPAEVHQRASVSGGSSVVVAGGGMVTSSGRPSLDCRPSITADPNSSGLEPGSTESAGPSIVWLAGDSSLDNKYWLLGQKKVEACNSYRGLIVPTRNAVPDVAHNLNIVLEQKRGAGPASPGSGGKVDMASQGGPVTHIAGVINCAVEESSLGERIPLSQKAWKQDSFIRDNIQPHDTLIISVGGNDIALKPTAGTVVSMLGLMWTPLGCLGYRFNPFTNHFIKLFKKQVTDYIQFLTEKNKPKQVIVSMIYYPCTKGSGWADRVLKFLSYNSNPAKLQAIIDHVYAKATKEIKVEGTVVTPVALSTVLDSTDEADYVARVEPSDVGGRKMAVAYESLMLP